MRSREHIHAPAHLGESIADAVTSSMGSWRFVIIQTGIVIVWIALNVWLLSRPFDPFPLVLLNLVFSTQSAYASPLILMSQNRQSEKDRRRDDLEADEIAQIFASHEILLSINKKQLEILNQQNEILDLLKHSLSRELIKKLNEQDTRTMQLLDLLAKLVKQKRSRQLRTLAPGKEEQS